MPSDHQQSEHSSSASFLKNVTKRLDEVRTAVSFFSRLPVYVRRPLSEQQYSDMFGASFWASPVAGLAIGLLAAAVLWIAQLSGVTSLVAIAILAFGAAITGGLHEDGLADLIDACGGGTRQRRLEIMKDSRIGSFGVCALILWFLAAFASLETFLAHPTAWLAILWTHVLSRGLLPLGIWALPSASDSGLGRQAKKTRLWAVGIALVLSLAATLYAGYWLPLLILILGQLATYALAWRLVGGATGDVFGAAQKIGELSAYLAFAILLAPGVIG